MARILAVDDDPQILKLIRFRLERAGHQVLAYSSARSALEALALAPQTHIPDLAVLDEPPRVLRRALYVSV